jgi:hypothetical protein
MQPTHPTVREELKRAHPGLTDADIDRYDALTSRRVTLDPSRSAAEIRTIDAERDELLRTKMPRLGQIENAFFARMRKEPCGSG